MMPLQYLLDNIVILLAQLAGLITAIVFLRRYTRPALLVIIATTISLLLRIAWPFFIEFVFRQEWDDRTFERVLSVAGWSSAIIQSVCWLLLVWAVFCSRRPITDQTRIEIPTQSDTINPIPISLRTTFMKPLSKGFYLGSIIGSFVLSWLLLIPGYILLLNNGSDEQALIGTGFVCFAYIPIIYSIVIFAILVYKLWAVLQDGPARTTPGKAVGFLFIPFFNLYWLFQAYWGWTVDYNKYIAQSGITGPRAPEGLALTFCILILCSMIPFVGILIALVNVVLLIIFFNSAINGANAIITATTTTIPTTPATVPTN